MFQYRAKNYKGGVASLSGQAGFSLLDVLVVVAIITILAAVAFPSYESIAKQGRRSDAVSMLQGIMQQQERFFLNNMTYTTDLAQLGYANTTMDSEDEYYNIAAAACGGSIARCVQLTATPQGGHAGDGTILLDSQGNQTANGDAATANVWGH